MTNPTGKPMGLTSALSDFFGRKPGQTLTEFRKEVSQLTPDDRAYFRKHLIAAGYTLSAEETTNEVQAVAA